MNLFQKETYTVFYVGLFSHALCSGGRQVSFWCAAVRKTCQKRRIYYKKKRVRLVCTGLVTCVEMMGRGQTSFLGVEACDSRQRRRIYKKRDLQKRPIYIKTDLLITPLSRVDVFSRRWGMWLAPKETYIQEKRPVCTKRDLYRDLYTCKKISRVGRCLV